MDEYLIGTFHYFLVRKTVVGCEGCAQEIWWEGGGGGRGGGGKVLW